MGVNRLDTAGDRQPLGESADRANTATYVAFWLALAGVWVGAGLAYLLWVIFATRTIEDLLTGVRLFLWMGCLPSAVYVGMAYFLARYAAREATEAPDL
jgi:hypothetical protein